MESSPQSTTAPDTVPPMMPPKLVMRPLARGMARNDSLARFGKPTQLSNKSLLSTPKPLVGISPQTHQ